MIGLCLQLFRERLSGKVHATIPKGCVGGFEFTVFQTNLNHAREVKTKRGVGWGGVRYASYGFVALGGEGWRNCEGTRLSLMWPRG